MSIKVKNVKAPPRAFQILNDYYLSGSGALIEHSPIYTEFSAEVNISGSYTSGFFDFDYSYTGSKTWTRTPIVGDSTAGMTKIENYNPHPINGVYETLYGSVASLGPPEAGKFVMGLRPAMDKPSGPFDDPAPMYVPQYPAAAFFLDSAIMDSAAVIGTQTNNNFSPPVVTDIISDIVVFPSFVFSDTITDPRQIVDVFSIIGGSDFQDYRAFITEDLTLWSAAKWRDFRGNYSATETDANGITTTLDVTLG